MGVFTAQPACLWQDGSRMPCNDYFVLFLCSQIPCNPASILVVTWWPCLIIFNWSVRSYQIQACFCLLPPNLCPFLLLCPSSLLLEWRKGLLRMINPSPQILILSRSHLEDAFFWLPFFFCMVGRQCLHATLQVESQS